MNGRLLRVCLGAAACLAPALAAAAPAPAGGGVVFAVRETAGVLRHAEVATGGVPLPRDLGVRNLAGLAVVHADGRRVPAQFRVLARWNAGRDDVSAPVQWLLVSLPATVGAGRSAGYRLIVDGSAGPNPPPNLRLRLSRRGSQLTVDTGAATFLVGGQSGALFDEIRGRDGALLVRSSEMLAAADGAGTGHPVMRSLRIEESGPLRAVVVLEGEYGFPPRGGGVLSSQRRYEFAAGSPTAIVRQVVRWEGNLGCQGCVKTAAGGANGWRLERVRDLLHLDPAVAGRALLVGEFAAPALEGRALPGGVALEQLLRPSRKQPVRFRAQFGEAVSTGAKADGAMLALSGSAGTVAVALARMHRYEPQGLRLLEDGGLAIDLAAEPVWLAHHQGLFATLAVAALEPQASRRELDRVLWAPLNRPLRPWTTAAGFAASDAVDEFPVGPLPAGFEDYDAVIPAILQHTREAVDTEGIAGLMTFGVLPRYWGQWGSPELDCKADPTPEAADDAFWCGTWTDYHNALVTLPIWAMRSGEVQWLDELAFPGALRTLHTQIMQCAPGDPWFYCGQAPAGYGGYRADFNSSHAYFENLFLYYWLTGDSTVLAPLQQGAESMRRRFCPQRRDPAAGACAAAEPLPRGVGLAGRVASQALAVFRFVGLAGEDAGFLDDFRSGLARALTHQYAELERDGQRYGFLEAPIGAAGAYTTGPILQNSLYDMNNLYRLQRDTGDAELGAPPLRPSRVIIAVARTIADFEARAGADGSVAEDWPQFLRFSFTGARIGGTLTSVEPDSRPLYGPEKASVAALLVRAGLAAGDARLVAAGRQVARRALTAAAKDPEPLGKVQGQYLLRLHAALGLLAQSPAPPRPLPPR